MKKVIFGVIIGIVISTVTFVIADTVASNQVSYDNTASGANATNVKTALDDLYEGVYNLAATAGGGMELVINKPKGLSSTPIGDLYRFQGQGGTTTDPNNYICFGTTNKDTCISEEGKQKYLYRIIGVTKSGQIKLIKWSSVGAYAWNNEIDNTAWEDSTLCAGLNGSYFLTHETDGVKDYVPEGWEARIALVKWKMARNADLTKIENDEFSSGTLETKEAKKIGLMYVSDYGYSGSSTLTYSGNNWLNLKHNGGYDSGVSNEWTISRDDRYYTYVFSVSSYGDVGPTYGPSGFSVRPVFYLESGEEIFDGEGTIEEPYILG